MFAAGEPTQGYSLELRCGASLAPVTLEPNQTVVLDCNLGLLEHLVNVTWKKNGLLLVEEENLRILPNGSLLVSSVQMDSEEGHALRESAVGGNYSCVSHGSMGSVAGRTIVLHVLSESLTLSPLILIP